MRRLVVFLVISFAVVAVIVFYAIRRTVTNGNVAPTVQATQNAQHTPGSNPTLIPISGGFVYPVGPNQFPKKLSQSKDGDGWYNAQEFGENNHLGEDWNNEAGGKSDCGAPVYASSDGTIMLATDAGTGWGNVMILRHRLTDDTLVETLYGHLQSIAKTIGNVRRGELIGKIGDANGAYPCHLHLELRLSDCPSWGAVGPGYAENHSGWTDPSDFIDAHSTQLPVKNR